MKITESSENIFDDIYPNDPAKAKNLRIRADLMVRIEKLIKRRGWTQAEAADVMKVTQPRISELVHGKIARFSIDSLMIMLDRAKVPMNVTPQRGSLSIGW